MLSKSALAFALGFIGSTYAVEPTVPAGWGASMNFTAGMIKVGSDMAVTGDNVGATVTIYDSYVCEEAQTALATIEAGAAGPIAGATIATITGKAAKLGEECVTIQSDIEGVTSYTAGIGNYGAEPVIVGKVITYPTGQVTADGVTTVTHTGNSLQFSITSETLQSGEKYQVARFAGATCTGTPVNNLVTGSVLPADPDAAQAELDNGAFDSGTVDDDGTFVAEIKNLAGSIATYADTAIGIYLSRGETEGGAPLLVTCGKIAYLPNVRGFVTAYNDAQGSVSMKGWVSGLQKVAGLTGSFHVHAKPQDVDSGGYSGPNCVDKASIGEHFLSEDETDYWATETSSLITYTTDGTTGTALLDAPLTGVPISAEDVRYQAVVIHTETSKDALEHELRVGCGTLGGVAPAKVGNGGTVGGGGGSSGASAVIPSVTAVFTAMAAALAF